MPWIIPVSCPPTFETFSALGKALSDGPRLSGDPKDIEVTDQALIDAFPEKKRMVRWLRMAGQKVKHMGFQRASAGWVMGKEKGRETIQ